MANRTFNFEFEQVPLIVDGLFEGADMSGVAEISYWPDGEWSIQSISIEVARPTTLDERTEERKVTDYPARFVRKQHMLDAGSPIYLILYDRLDADKNGHLSEAVKEHINDDRDDAREWLGQQRRDDVMAVL